MRPALLFVVLCVVAAFAPLAFGQSNTLVAKIFGTGVDPTVTGQVTFTKLNATFTRVHVHITGITVNPDSEHGIHVHMWGDTTHVNGTKAGPHLVFTDPDTDCALGNCDLTGGHGCPETNGTNRHAGDMGNWQATGGVINMSKELDLLNTDGPLNIVGHAVILHELADSCAAQSYGHAGSRLGQGVIGVAWGNGQAVDATHWASAKANPGGRFVCLLRGTAGNDISGQFLVEPPDDVRIRIVGWVKGLNGTNGQQWGVHVHEFGDIVATNNGTSVGGHYNPGGAVHALPPTAQRHVGDLGNIGSTVANGAVWYDQQLPGTIINHHYGPNSLLGRGLIIHSKVDDGCTQPTGDAGSRLAWCIWGLSSQSGDTASTVATVVAASGRGGSTPPAVPAFTAVSCDGELPPDGARGGSASGLFVSMAMIIVALVAALLL